MHKALLIYSVFQSLLFALALISGGKRANRPLALYFTHIFLSDVFFSLTNGYLDSSFSTNEFIRVTYEFIALCRPAIIFYFLYSILEKPLPKILYGLWILPVLNLIIDYSFQAIDIDFYNAGFYHNWYLNFPMYTKGLLVALLLWQITVFKKEIAENSSSKKHYELIKLYWGKYFVYFLLTLSLFSSLYIFITLSNGRWYTFSSTLLIYSPDYYNIIYQAFTTLFLLVFGYLALRNPSIFNTPSDDSSVEQKIAEIVLPEEEKTFSKKLELSDEQIQHYTIVVNKLIENEKVYLDPELSLSKLAELSSIPSRQLSQFIQAVFHKNYKEYINDYRVLNAQKMLTQSNTSHYTMYAIAFESGFNSESSFYKIFKQQTTLTPKQYQDKFKERVSS